MQNLELEAETIQISIYTNIVLNILKTHGESELLQNLFQIPRFFRSCSMS